MKKIGMLLQSLLVSALLFFLVCPYTLRAGAVLSTQTGTGVPVHLTSTTDTFGETIYAPAIPLAGNGVFLDGLIIGSTTPGHDGTQVTLNFYDQASSAGLTTTASWKLSIPITTSDTAQTIPLPATGIWFKNGIVYVDQSTTTVNATAVYSTR